MSRSTFKNHDFPTIVVFSLILTLGFSGTAWAVHNDKHPPKVNGGSRPSVDVSTGCQVDLTMDQTTGGYAGGSLSVVTYVTNTSGDTPLPLEIVLNAYVSQRVQNSWEPLGGNLNAGAIGITLAPYDVQEFDYGGPFDLCNMMGSQIDPAATALRVNVTQEINGFSRTSRCDDFAVEKNGQIIIYSSDLDLAGSVECPPDPLQVEAVTTVETAVETATASEATATESTTTVENTGTESTTDTTTTTDPTTTSTTGL